MLNCTALFCPGSVRNHKIFTRTESRYSYNVSKNVLLSIEIMLMGKYIKLKLIKYNFRFFKFGFFICNGWSYRSMERSLLKESLYDPGVRFYIHYRKVGHCHRHPLTSPELIKLHYGNVIQGRVSAFRIQKYCWCRHRPNFCGGIQNSKEKLINICYFITLTKLLWKQLSSIFNTYKYTT